MAASDRQQNIRIGFIGMGYMGRLMAQRLLEAGYPLTVYNRTAQKAQKLVQQGARLANSPHELAHECDIVMSCVTDNQALNAIMVGPDGAIAGAREGTIFIDLSTVSPQESRLIAKKVSDKGANMIDAAVAGSTPQAEGGNLVIFVGGKQEIYQRCKPLLDILGRAVFYMGESGKGTTMKMVVNTLLGLELQAIAEAIALGEKAGLEKNLLLDVLSQTTVIAPAHKQKLENARKEQYPVNFALSLMHKDFGLIMRLAAELSAAMPATAAAEQMYASALAQGKDEDFSVMIQFMEKMAGLASQQNK